LGIITVLDFGDYSGDPFECHISLPFAKAGIARLAREESLRVRNLERERERKRLEVEAKKLASDQAAAADAAANKATNEATATTTAAAAAEGPKDDQMEIDPANKDATNN
jgi:hypothetical protein